MFLQAIQLLISLSIPLITGLTTSELGWWFGSYWEFLQLSLKDRRYLTGLAVFSSEVVEKAILTYYIPTTYYIENPRFAYGLSLFKCNLLLQSQIRLDSVVYYTYMYIYTVYMVAER